MKQQHGNAGNASYFTPAVKRALSGSFSEHEGGQIDDKEGTGLSGNETGNEDTLDVNESDPSSSQLPE